jgi:alpha-beta hydrolase superfamily lysophospholipase
MRTATEALPSEMGTRDGLAYSLWLPERGGPARGGVVILHGAGSCKESHHDYARFVLAAGFAAIVFDQRGHGASEGPMDGRILDDVCTMATLLRSNIGDQGAAIALRGSSMGGFLAILAAPLAHARAVVAICPPSPSGLRRALAAGALRFDADVQALDTFLAASDLESSVESLEVPLLLLHAEGDEQVPVQHSRELAEHMSAPGSRLITLPGGHHRSIQHDDELQAVSLRFIEQALA